MTVPPKPDAHLRIMLTADNHLRDMHAGVLKRGPDFTAAAMEVVEKAAEHNCDSIINAGDFLNINKPSSTNIHDMMAINEALQHQGVSMPMYLISGNHDFAAPSWAKALFGERRPGDPGIIPADNLRFECESIPFVCLPWMPKPALVEVLKTIPDNAVLVWHGAVQEFAGFPSDNDLSLAELQPERFRAVLLGDIHQRQFIETFNGKPCLVGYPGATELVEKTDPLTHSCEIIDIPLDRSLCCKHYQVMLTKPRLAMAFHIGTEAQLMEVGYKVKLVEDQEPLVFVKFDSRIEQVLGRLYAMVDRNKVILRAEPMPMLDLSGGGVQVLELGPTKTVEDMVPQHFPFPGPLQTLAHQCCLKTSNPSALINSFVAERLKLPETQCA